MRLDIEIAPEVREDFDCVFDHYANFDPVVATEVIEGIVEALDILRAHPMIGRPAGAGRRELLIGRGKRAFAALYSVYLTLDRVKVVAVRSQNESGYKRR
jgi:plasmid stabilization system protein ParE